MASIGGSSEIIDARDKQLEQLTPQELTAAQQLADEISQRITSKDYEATSKKVR